MKELTKYSKAETKNQQKARLSLR